jgi:hypothetical protein
MGLLKGVIEGSLETAYRSLKYREDSNQPYIVVPIPDYTDESGMNFALRAPDFFLRQGALSTTNANIASSRGINIGLESNLTLLNPLTLNPFDTVSGTLVLRLQANPFDLDAPVPTDALRVGRFLFDTKNIAGTLFSVKQNLLERTRVNAPGAGRRVYVPYSTVLQSAVGQFGFHLDKTGLNPLDFDRRGYFDVTLENERNLGNSGNRLVLIYQTKQVGFPTVAEIGLAESLYDIDTQNEGYIYSYRGGPDTLGVGKTRVRIDGTGYGDPSARTNNYNPSSLTSQDKNTYVFGNSLIESQGNQGINSSLIPKDFRQTINEFVEPDLANNPSKQVLPYTDYVNFNRDKTYGENVDIQFSSPELKKAAQLNPVGTTLKYDLVNALPPMLRKTAVTQYFQNDPDLVPFYFQIIDNDATETAKYDKTLFFRAYINNISDSYKADWQSYKYVGRAENFYKYTGFSRDCQLSFTIYAHSNAEMLPLYAKLNWLLGTTAPNYSNAGYMRGNFIYLTVGSYFNSMPCIISSINLKPSFEAGWDIDRDQEGKVLNNGIQLPKMIEVDLSFVPLYNYTPNLGINHIGDENLVYFADLG